jgi:catechol 2,3-dioxygenase-like lactoylglutathione lyase family enzyme
MVQLSVLFGELLAGEAPKLNALIPELYCTSIKASIAFYTEILGFEILYQREEATFAMLERQGAKLMLDEYVHGSARSWITGPLETLFGRGMNLDIRTDNVEERYEKVKAFGAKISRSAVTQTHVRWGIQAGSAWAADTRRHRRATVSATQHEVEYQRILASLPIPFLAGVAKCCDDLRGNKASCPARPRRPLLHGSAVSSTSGRVLQITITR